MEEYSEVGLRRVGRLSRGDRVPAGMQVAES